MADLVPTQPSATEVVITDEMLVARLRAGETRAGEDLARRHATGLMRYLHRVSGSAHLAEELHQQTWLSVLDHIDKFDPSMGGFKAWLFRIATNKAHDHWRSQSRQRSAQNGLRLVTEISIPGPDARLDDTEQQVLVRNAIDQLPEAQRQVVLLRYYSGLKFVEIAELLGCPLNTALGRMHKAVLKLKSLMSSPEGASHG